MRKVIIALAALPLAACATKHYGREMPLSPTEKAEYSCRDINLEIAKVREFQQQVRHESHVNGKSALGFLGDFGIGNAMEKSDAEKSSDQRMDDLEELRIEKHCA